MQLSAFKKVLTEHSDKNIRFILPTGTKIPAQAHVTEVARIDKRFIDCGGTFRTESVCRLQTWFSDDTDHRLTAGKLNSILQKAASLLESDDLEVDVEYEAPFISQFPISATEVEGEGQSLVLHLGTKHTACLAEEKCLPPALASNSTLFKPIPSFSQSKCCS